MAKRLTDSEKWEDPWFLDLNDTHKLMWLYLLDKCDHAGIWKVNKRLAEFCFGHDLDWQRFIEVCKDRIQVLPGGEKWHIPKFLTFQYGPLDKPNSMFKSVFPLLEKEGLRTEGLPPVNGVMVMDKKWNKEKETVFLELWKQYPNKSGKTKAEERFSRSVKAVGDLEAIREAFKRYIKHLQANTWKKPQDGKTWFNSWRDWVEYEEEKVPVEARRQAKPDSKHEACNGTGKLPDGVRCWCWK